MAVFFVLAVMLITGLLASRKGYSFWLWFFAAGVLGLITIACLPFANLPEQSWDEQEELKRKANNYALVLIVAGFIFGCCLFRNLKSL